MDVNHVTVRLPGLLSVSLVILAASVGEHAGQEADRQRELLVGETGIVNVPTETRVGELTLQRGRYRVEHRVDEQVHYIEFTLLSTPYRTDWKAASGEVVRQLEPLGKTAARTTLFTVSESFVDARGRVFLDRMTKIEIRGENVAQVFSEGRDR